MGRINNPRWTKTIYTVDGWMCVCRGGGLMYMTGHSDNIVWWEHVYKGTLKKMLPHAKRAHFVKKGIVSRNLGRKQPPHPTLHTQQCRSRILLQPVCLLSSHSSMKSPHVFCYERHIFTGDRVALLIVFLT